MFTYAEIEALTDKLKTERALLLAAVNRLNASSFIRPCDGGWSAQDILAHLAAAEQLNFKFAKLMVTQDSPVQLTAFAADYPDFTGEFSLDRFNAYLIKKLRTKSLAEVLDGLEESRGETLAWVETLTPDQLERGGQHAVWGNQNVRGMLRILALHDKIHTKDILKRASQAV